MYKLKSVLRLIQGYAMALLTKKQINSRRLYINLALGGIVGGPSRFLGNFVDVACEQGVNIENRTPKGCDAALVFSVSWGNSFVKLCKNLGVRSVLRIDGFYYPIVSENGKMLPISKTKEAINNQMREDIASFDHVIYQSRFTKEQADINLYRRDTDFSIIYNGVDVSTLYPIRTDSKDHLTIVMLGNHSRGHLTLGLRVFEALRLFMQCKLLLIGPMRGNRSISPERFVSEYFQSNSILDDIDCLGAVPYANLAAALSQGDIMLHTKLGDNCPNAVLEALSCGLPVVCPEWGGTSELIGNGGISVSGMNIGANQKLVTGMAEAILAIVSEIDQYKLEARKRAVSLFDRKKIVREYLEVLRFS